MKLEVEKAWDDLFQATAEPRWSLIREICAAMIVGLSAGVIFGLIFCLK
jgi:hypothetical protein